MAYKPLKMTEADVKRSVKNLGKIPPKLVVLFKNRAKDPKPCIAACEKILKKNPKHGIAHLYMAEMAEERGDYKALLPHAMSLTTHSPLISKGWLWRGMAELILHKPARARTSFMRYGEFSQGDVWALCLIAMTYFVQRKAGAALYLLDHGIQDERIKDKKMLLYVRAIVEEGAGDTKAALTHLIEVQMMAKGLLKRNTASKIHELVFLEKNEVDGEEI